MLTRLIIAAVAILAQGCPASAQEQQLIVAATTSVQDAGLLNILLPKFYARTGMTVRVLSRASSLALLTAERGEVDLAIVNDPAAVDRFVQRNPGSRGYRLMYNDFLIAGPVDDPAGVKTLGGAAAALREIARTRSRFISRGDDSGTHHAEQKIWRAAQVDPKLRSGNWFTETGLGMGATLQFAARQNAYVVVDRGTWLAEGDRSQQAVVVQGDPILFNQYQVVLMRPDGTATPQTEATVFLDWLLSSEGQDAIGSLRVSGEQLFFPNAYPQETVGKRSG